MQFIKGISYLGYYIYSEISS